MSRTSRNGEMHKAVVLLCGVVIASAAIGALYWAQIVFVPVALSVLFVFLLTRPVRWLEKWRIKRGVAVAIVVSIALFAVGELSWLVTRQTTSLAQELPNYEANIRKKVDSLREMSGGWDRFLRMIDDVKAPPENLPQPPPEQRVVVQPETTWLSRWPFYLGSAAEFAASAALTIVLTVFGLARREDVRNRFLRLIGHRRLAFTTKAVDEAGERVSRYLTMQAVINICYGAAFGLGLGIIGVKYFVLWGFFAAMLRYVPYIGAWISMMFPLAVSVATSESWAQPMGVLGIFIALEVVTYNLVEPLLFKRSMGVSEVAQLVSAAFWGFLWGPIGLVLSAPLTVCLLVLGKYVPQLQFLDVLLGDAPALEPSVSLYQRLLASDFDDAATLVDEQVKATSPEAVYDDLLIPTLSFVKRDRGREEIDDDDEAYILRATGDLVDDLSSTPTPAAGTAGSADRPVRLLACPAFDRSDVLALGMLDKLLSPDRWDVDVINADALAAEVVDRAAEERIGVVVVGSLVPGGLAHSRYLCKRLRSQLPDAKILVGRFGGKTDGENEQLLDAGADVVATTLLAARNQLNAWLPILSQADARPNLGPADAHRPGVSREALATV